MNIIQFLEGLWPFKPAPAGTSPQSPSAFQTIKNEVGAAIDTIEGALNILQSNAQYLPDPYKGYVAAVAIPVHVLDGYWDTLETPAPAPAPAPVPPTPVPAAPGQTPTANL